MEKEVQNLTHRLELVKRESRHSSPTTENRRTVEGEHGILLVDQGSTKYINHEVLVNSGAQLDTTLRGSNIRETDMGLLAGSSESTIDIKKSRPQRGDGEDDSVTQSVDAKPRRNIPTTGNEFLFQYSSMVISLSSFHPSRVHHRVLWNLYEENVAPLVMIAHRPSLRQLMSSVAVTAVAVDRASEALIFAVYFAAITSLNPTQCTEIFGQDHSALQQHYRFATQQALARANFLQSQSLTVLQATTLFLTCLRGAGDAAFVWAMTAAIRRIAQGLGLHRDGTCLGLSPFETEVRRRMWWAIYLLDCQSSEIRAIGTQQTNEHISDTKLPLNINNSDISPESAAAPQERSSFTDMAFCLIRCEMTALCRQLRSDRHSSSPHVVKSLHALKQIHSRLRKRYLDFCDVRIPLQWVTATVIRLALARSWLIAHLPDGMPTEEQVSLMGSSAADGLKREQLFVTAIEVLEFAYLLETDPRTKQWSWLFQGYPQWHAAIFVLQQICTGPQSRLTDRAWAVVSKAVSCWRNTDFHKDEIPSILVSRLVVRAAVVQGCIWGGGEREDRRG
ncbi:hypothetical protein AbraIFM66951_004098 [Aspergillus brasiliensis]|uniref:Xylanolytic transcriptional activator regulatory domain-containing protein n=1 Tax=Aspergillus brasiliensis TaxID=319629 RepID=A0A9W5YRA6_9EURO|nr:hypothetical protein AbraCBS73388_006459 [Aspergillus brasiliensis]GKZ50734.1 hypothetical protein AbraIFM66951_004098 [Aspergillus brasiliensis]